MPSEKAGTVAELSRPWRQYKEAGKVKNMPQDRKGWKSKTGATKRQLEISISLVSN